MRPAGLDDDGYGVTTLLDPAQAGRLRDQARARLGPHQHGFHATSADAERATAIEIDGWLRHELREPLERMFPDHEPFLAALITKAGGSTVAVAFHQDWTYTDERDDQAGVIWLPLVDVDEDGGALRVVPGSHRWFAAIRPGGCELPTDAFQDALAARATTIPLRAGQALVYHPALLHGSWPNAEDRDRDVVAIALAPRGAPLLHFHLDPATGLEGFEIEADYYTAEPFGARPSRGRPVSPWTGAVTEHDLARALQGHPIPADAIGPAR